MVITKLYGGLGNQMYQYAAGLSLAQRLNSRHYLDLDWFEEIKGNPEITQRSYELDGFGIQPRGISIVDKLQLKLSHPAVLKEPDFRYDSQFETVSGNILLDGYWQSYKYFEKYSPLIVEAFSFPSSIKPGNKDIIEKMRASNSVTLHVRHGDYATKQGKAYHGLLPVQYYRQAIAQLSKKIEKPSFFIFSDDLEWCEKNIKLDGPVTFVDSNSSNSGVEDMQMMSSAKHMIIANSSFSWWAAWLNQNPGKLVFAPLQWFKGVEHEIDDRLPPEWIRM
jgi:hypothetical protein